MLMKLPDPGELVVSNSERQIEDDLAIYQKVAEAYRVAAEAAWKECQEELEDPELEKVVSECYDGVEIEEDPDEQWEMMREVFETF